MQFVRVCPVWPRDGWEILGLNVIMAADPLTARNKVVQQLLCNVVHHFCFGNLLIFFTINPIFS